MNKTVMLDAEMVDADMVPRRSGRKGLRPHAVPGVTYGGSTGTF